MAFLSDLFNKVTGKTPNRLDSYIMKMLANAAIYPSESSEWYLNAYTGNNDVFTVINKITEPASMLPVFQYDKEGNLVENGKMISLLNKPNPHQTRGELIEAAISFFLLWGNSYTAGESIDMGLRKGEPLRLDVLPPQWVQIDLGTYFNPIAGYSFYPMLNSGIDYAKEAVYHWKEFNPDFTYSGGHLKGMSRLKPLLKSVTGSVEAYNSLVKAFQQQGAWGILTMLDEEGKAETLNAEQKSQLKSKFKADKKSGDFTISNMDTKWNQLGLTLVELEVLKAIGLFKGNLCDAYNVPSQLLSGSQDRTYSNYKEAEQALWRNAIQPSVDSYLAGLTAFLAPKFKEEGHVLKADYSNVACLQKNLGELITWMANANVFTGNQILEACGWELSDDPNMDRILVSAGKVFLDDLGLPPDPAMTEALLKRLKITDYRTK
jgi:HK97 family phage portal protein